MADPRIAKLARVLVRYSLDLQPGQPEPTKLTTMSGLLGPRVANIQCGQTGTKPADSDGPRGIRI